MVPVAPSNKTRGDRAAAVEEGEFKDVPGMGLTVAVSAGVLQLRCRTAGARRVARATA